MIIGPVEAKGFVLYDGEGNQLSLDAIAGTLNDLLPQGAPRAYVLDGHLLVRLPHAQTHLVQDLTQAELEGLRAACEDRLIRMRANADSLVQLIAREKGRAEPAGSDLISRTHKALEELKTHGITAEVLDARCADGLPHHRLTWPGGVSQVLDAKEVRRRADALRKKAKAS